MSHQARLTRILIQEVVIDQEMIEDGGTIHGRRRTPKSASLASHCRYPEDRTKSCRVIAIWRPAADRELAVTWNRMAMPNPRRRTWTRPRSRATRANRIAPFDPINPRHTDQVVDETRRRFTDLRGSSFDSWEGVPCPAKQLWGGRGEPQISVTCRARFHRR